MANKLLKNSVYLTGEIETIDLQKKIFEADHPTCAGKTAIRGNIALNTSSEDVDEKQANIISVPVFAFEPDEKSSEFIINNFKVLTQLLENPDNNIGRRIKLSTSFIPNIFQDKNTGDVVENVKLNSPFFNSPRPNDKNQAMFSGTVLIDKAPTPMEDRDGNPILSDNNIPKYRGKVQIFDDYRKLMYPLDIVIEEPGAEWMESVAENKDIYNVYIDLVSQSYEQEREIEGAFGTPQIVKSTYTRNERLLYWANPTPVLEDDPEKKEEILKEYSKNYQQLVDKEKNTKSLEKEKNERKEVKVDDDVDDLSFDW